MKAALLLGLLMVVSCDQVIRPFTNAFLYNTVGKSLPNECMDATFDSYMAKLKEQADAQQTTSAMITLISIADHFNTSCPVATFKSIFDTLAAKVKDPAFIQELIAHGVSSLDILIKEHNNKNKTPESVGTAIGLALQPFLKTNHLRLEKKHYHAHNGISDNIWALFEGVAEGLANGDQFLCKAAIANNREKLEDLIEKIKKLIEEGKVKIFLNLFF